MEAIEPSIRLSQVIAGLSHALDMTEGEPQGHAVRSCLIGMRLAHEIGLDADARSDLFYALLLKDAGCSVNSARMAALFGVDDQWAKRTSMRVDWARSVPAAVWAVRTVEPAAPWRRRAERLFAIRREGDVTRAFMQARCDRGADIARLLGLSEATAQAIGTLDEHWDGHGQPRGLRGDAIPLLGRIVCLAQTVELFHGEHGVPGAVRVAVRRSRTWFDPALVDVLVGLQADTTFWGSLRDADVTAWEPPERVLEADDARLDRIAGAFAGVVDAKSPWTYHHSDRASLIATSLGAMVGVDVDELPALRRASLLHDVGKLAISNRILDKPARLTDREFARVREHPLFSEQILAGVPGLSGLADVAGAHHERLDGSGYPRGRRGDELTMPMRVLAVADVYEAITADRPYRRAMSSDEALAAIRAEVPRRLDGDAFGALEALLSRREGAPPFALRRAETVVAPDLLER